MKNMIKKICIIAAAALIVLSMTACENAFSFNTPTNEDFKGKWVHSGVKTDPNFNDYSFEFQGDILQFLNIDGSGNTRLAIAGFFYFTKKEITFIGLPGTWEGWTQRYAMKGNRLILYESTASSLYGIYGTFIKQ